jgi:hypothetical protein
MSLSNRLAPNEMPGGGGGRLGGAPASRPIFPPAARPGRRKFGGRCPGRGGRASKSSDAAAGRDKSVGMPDRETSCAVKTRVLALVGHKRGHNKSG